MEDGMEVAFESSIGGANPGTSSSSSISDSNEVFEPASDAAALGTMTHEECETMHISQIHRYFYRHRSVMQCVKSYQI